jgi:cell division protein FtsB
MIRINLLPTEKRKAERTPLPRFLLIASTAAAFFILLFYNLWILKMISDVVDETKRNRQTLADLQPKVQEYERLLAEETQLRTKVKEIESLVNRDVEYWRMINALWDVIHANPRVWVDDFRILDSRSAPGDIKRVDPENKEAVAYGVAMKCHVASEDVLEMTKFRKSLKEHPLLQEILTLINFNVMWNLTEERPTVKDGDPIPVIDFDISMYGLATPPKRKAPTPPAGPAKPGSTPIGTQPTPPAPGGTPK